MLLSIFTPSHDTSRLQVPSTSLMIQSFSDYEWVVGLNNGATLGSLSSINLRRVEIPAHEEYGSNVGYVKRETCRRCVGDYLIELDHDDELVPDALLRIKAAIVAYERRHGCPPDFLYSNAVHLHETEGSKPYSGRFGWRKPSSITWDKAEHETNPSFPVSAASLHDIFYSPDHVRVWRRGFYEQIGGHDETLSIADDHDLLQRTYIAGGRMHRMNDLLYIYHKHADGSNTYLQRNAAIQKQQALNGDKHRAALIQEWCRREDLIRIELGGGKTVDESGVVGIALSDSDMDMDVWNGLPFEDNSVGHVHAQDFLEHIPHCRASMCSHVRAHCTVGLMNEIHRVLAPNGWFTSRTPSTGGRGAFQDPTHCSFWNPNSFWYYTNPDQQRFLRGNVTAKFISKRVFEHYPNDYCKRNDILYVDAVLIALKEAHQPGENLFWRDYDNPI